MESMIARTKSKKFRILFAISLLCVLALLAFCYWFFFLKGLVSTDDARFGGNLVDVAPEVGGTLVRLNVIAGDSVRAGQVLFELDTVMLASAIAQNRATLETAKGGLTQAEANLRRVLNGPRPEEINGAVANVKRLTNEAELSAKEVKRVESLFLGNAVSQDQLDRAKTTLESALQSQDAAAQTLAMLKQGSRAEDISSARAALTVAQGRLAEAEAALAKSQSDRARCTVTAPFDGWVVRRWVDPGAMVSAGRPVVTVYDPKTIQVEANIEEKQLHDVALGDQCDIAVDAYPGLHLQGKVVQILRGANSKFSLVPAEGVSGTFIKVSQRVPLRIAVQVPPDLPIGPGLSVVVHIHVGSSGK